MTRISRQDAAEIMRQEINELIAPKGLKILALHPQKPKSGHCDMYCDTHGDGSAWDNPWVTTPATLKRGLGCPKCSGLYKRSERELLEVLSQAPFAHGVTLGERTTDFNGSNTRYLVVCQEHGDSTLWNTPYDIIANTLSSKKVKIACPKCSSTYTKTPEEKIKDVNNKIKEKGLHMVSWVTPGEHGQNSRCKLHCKMHGNGWEWTTPWLPTYGNLYASTGCPKCAKSYQPTQDEYLSLAQDAIEKHRLAGTAELKVIGYEGEYNRVLSYLHVDCPIHGAVFTSKNCSPSLRSVIKNGLRCFLCERAGKTELIQAKADDQGECPPSSHITPPQPLRFKGEGVHHLLRDANKALRERGLTVVDFDPLKPMTSDCHVLCDTHGDTQKWDSPWKPSLSHLMNGLQCPQCAGRYKRSERELLELLNGLPRNEGVTLLPATESFRGNSTRYPIFCEQHGNSNSWDKSCTFNAGYLLKKCLITCPKCEEFGHHSSEEKITNLNKKLAVSGLQITRWQFEMRAGVDDRCFVACSKHGPGEHFGTPWIPKYYALKEGQACPKCAGKYTPSAEELLVAIQEKIDLDRNTDLPKLTVQGYIGEHKSGLSQLHITCEKHGDILPVREGPYLARKVLKSGVYCVVCKKEGKKTRNTVSRSKKTAEDIALAREELLSHVSQLLDQNNCQLITLGEGSKQQCKVEISCNVHGDTREWGNPWIPTVRELEVYTKAHQGKGCPQCAGHYRPSEQETVNDVMILAQEHQLIYHGFLHDTFKNRTESKVKLSCAEHGNGWEWPTPWVPSVRNFIQSGSGCPRCKDRIVKTADERIEEVNKKLSERGIVILGIHDTFKGAFSKVRAHCHLHGNGWEWDTPWLPTFDNIRGGKGCPKCSGTYRETEDSLLSQAAQAADNMGIEFHGILGPFKGVISACHVTCPIHGSGTDMSPAWTPEIRQIISGTGGCKICAKNMGSMKSYLDSLDRGDAAQKRSLYYVAFKCAEKVFYKIGLATHDGGVDQRYRPSLLEADGVEILWYKEITLDNGIAMLLEAAILSYFDSDRDLSCLQIISKSNGGTECFANNILPHIRFHELLMYATKNYGVIRESERLYCGTLSKVSQAKLMAFIESQKDSLPETFDDDFFHYNGIRRRNSDRSSLPGGITQMACRISTDLNISPDEIILQPKPKTEKRKAPRRKREKIKADISHIQDESFEIKAGSNAVHLDDVDGKSLNPGSSDDILNNNVAKKQPGSVTVTHIPGFCSTKPTLCSTKGCEDNFLLVLLGWFKRQWRLLF